MKVRSRLRKWSNDTASITLGEGALLDLYVVGTKIGGAIILFGEQPRKAKGIHKIMVAYGAGTQAYVWQNDEKPRVTQIVGIVFSDQRHAELVLERIIESYFPPIIERKYGSMKES